MTTKQEIACLKKCAKEHNAVLEVNQKLTTKRYSSLWYGGSIAAVKFQNGYTMNVDAIGDVFATLYDKDENTLAESRDKNNAGIFAEEMRCFFATDKKLIEEERAGRLIVNNNNWYEISVIDPENHWHDLEWVADGDNWASAIQDAIEGLDVAIKWIDGGVR